MADQANAYTGIGPGRIFLGDPTTADGADMEDLGDHETVNFAPNFSVAFSNSANTGDLPMPQSLRSLSPAPVLTVELYDQQIQNLKDILAEMVEIVDDGSGAEALVARVGVKQITPYTICFIPRDEVDDGADAEHGLWLPSAFCQNIGDLFNYGRLEEGENNNPFTAEFAATRPDEDDLDTDAVAIYGPPAAEGLSWSLP